MNFYSPFFPSFDGAYKTLLHALLNHGAETAPRGLKIRELINVSFEIPGNNCALDFTTTAAPERAPIWKKYVEDELAWYLSGNDLASSAPSNFWGRLANAEGRINSNYGKMILHDQKYPGGLTAFEFVVKTLKEDHESRQAVLYYGAPSYHVDGCKDVPCTIASQLLWRGGVLHMSVYQRSCDCILGLSYDIPFHGFMLKRIAEALSTEVGTITHFSGSLHLYEKHYELARRIITPNPPL